MSVILADHFGPETVTGLVFMNELQSIIVTTKKTSAIRYAFEGIINFSTEQKFRNKMLKERAET